MKWVKPCHWGNVKKIWISLFAYLASWFIFSLASSLLSISCRKEYFMFNNDRTHKVWSERVRTTKTEPAVSDPAQHCGCRQVQLFYTGCRESAIKCVWKPCVIIFPEHQITFMKPVIKHKRPVSLCKDVFFPIQNSSPTQRQSLRK